MLRTITEIDLLISLRPWTQNDIPRLLEIEEAVHVAPWNRDAFLMCFQQGYIGYVATLDASSSTKSNAIAGFVILSVHTEECHILNIGVAQSYQRQGIGKQLLIHALEEAKKKHHATVAFLEVRRSNTRAIHLYTTLHFEKVAERKHYYPGPHEPEDALIFVKLLTDPSSTLRTT